MQCFYRKLKESFFVDFECDQSGCETCWLVDLSVKLVSAIFVVDLFQRLHRLGLCVGVVRPHALTPCTYVLGAKPVLHKTHTAWFANLYVKLKKRFHEQY